MAYCAYCGSESHEEATVCMHCGCSVKGKRSASGGNESTLETVIKVFLVIGCVSQGWAVIPLAWCLPITISVFNHLRDRRPVGTGMKICVLLFVNMIAGICLLCMNDD